MQEPEEELDLEQKIKELRLSVWHLLTMAMLAETWEEAKEQIAELQEQAGKLGLKISFEKTKIMTNIPDTPTRVRVGGHKIEVVRSFKYLGEWIEWNNLEGKTMEARRTKMELAFQNKNTYNKKSLFFFF